MRCFRFLGTRLDCLCYQLAASLGSCIFASERLAWLGVLDDVVLTLILHVVLVKALEFDFDLGGGRSVVVGVVTF